MYISLVCLCVLTLFDCSCDLYDTKNLLGRNLLKRFSDLDGETVDDAFKAFACFKVYFVSSGFNLYSGKR